VADGWRAKPYPDADPQQINKYACGCRYTVQPDRDMTFSVVNPGRKLSALTSTDSITVDEKRGQVVFNPLHETNKGKYRCKAFNDVGTVTATGTVTVKGQCFL